MVCGETPGDSPGGEAAAGGMLGLSLELSAVIREGRLSCGKGDEGFPLFAWGGWGRGGGGGVGRWAVGVGGWGVGGQI